MAEHRFPTPRPVRLDVRIPAGDIEVETVDGEEAVVVLEGPERLVDETHVTLAGDRLVVEHPARRFVGFSGLFGGSLHVRVRVPHGSAAALATASADAALRGRFASLETRSASGDLVVDGDVAGDATVKTVSGDVRLPHVGGRLTVQTVSGDVSAASVDGSVSAKSVSGDVRIDSVREGHASFTSVSGDVEVGVAPGSLLDVDAGSVSGHLSSEVPLAGEPSAADGDGPRIVLRGKTVSGDVKVFRAA